MEWWARAFQRLDLVVGQTGTHPDPRPVILYLQQLRSPLLDRDPNRRRARVERVFDELLERVRGALDDLAPRMGLVGLLASAGGGVRGVERGGEGVGEDR